MKIKGISTKLQNQLLKVKPSIDFTINYRPCQVRLKNGDILDRVLVSEYQSYINTWGVLPDEDSGKKEVLIEDVDEIFESPFRMSAENATNLYDYGESGMGYVLFSIRFDNGDLINAMTGNVVDFPPIPMGLTTQNIVEIKPSSNRKNLVNGSDYIWCLFKGDVPKIEKNRVGYKKREKIGWLNKIFK